MLLAVLAVTFLVAHLALDWPWGSALVAGIGAGWAVGMVTRERPAAPVGGDELRFAVVGAPPSPVRPLPPALTHLATELVRHGRKAVPDGRSDSRFLGEARASARAIGETLYARGGHDAMLAAHAAVRDALGVTAARELEVAWDGIGQWGG